jgi:hypothetical protein
MSSRSSWGHRHEPARFSDVCMKLSEQNVLRDVTWHP